MDPTGAAHSGYAQLRGIGQIDGQWVLAGASVVFTSADAQGWMARPAPLDFAPETLLRLPAELSALGLNGFVQSTVNGREWFARAGVPPETKGTGSIAYGSGNFIRTGRFGVNYRSIGGRVWTRLPTTFGGNSAGSIASDSGRFVSADIDAIGKLWTSENGREWSSVVLPAFTTPFYRVVHAVPGKFFALATDGSFAVGAPGAWQRVQPGFSVTTQDITLGYGHYVAVGNGIAISNDGLAWTKLDVNLPGQLKAVAYGNGRTLAIGTMQGGSGSFTAVSTDDLNWSSAVSSVGASDLKFVDGRFVAVSSNGVWYSEDGQVWDRVAPGGVHLIQGTTGNGSALLTGYANPLWQSAPTADWFPIIVTQPQNATAAPGRNLTLHVEASGTHLSYQWRRNGAALVDGPHYRGAQNDRLIISGLSAEEAGNYTVTISNELGSANSSTAVVRLDETITFDSWRLVHFTAGELAVGAISGAAADPDADGLSNLTEYELGLDPHAPSVSDAPLAGLNGNDWTFTYTRPADRDDVSYVVEYSTDLATWNSYGLTHQRIATVNGIETWRARIPLSAAYSAYFFRLRVSR